MRRFAYIVCAYVGGMLALAFIAGFVAALLLVSHAMAQEPEVGTFGYGHMENHEQYKDWHNASGMSCCNGQDCRPVRARPDGDGKWSIWIPEYHAWVPVPASAKLQPDLLKDGRSHACTADPNVWKEYGRPAEELPVYCFSHAEIKS
jgi:hypothetical protein